MADQARPRERASQPAIKTKVVRSQKITQVASPVESLARQASALDLNDSDDATSVPNALPRSHTPSHLATNIHASRRKLSESAIRQRSQSAAQIPGSTIPSAAIPISRLQSTFTLPTSKPPAPATASAGGPRRSPNDESSETLTSRDRPDSPTGSGKEGPPSAAAGRRTTAMRSTSAIAGKTSASGTSSAASSSSPHTRLSAAAAAAVAARGQYTAFPPMADPSTAPDVPDAPASGMYWSQAPVSGAPHPALRAHSTTLVGSNVFVFGGCDARACFNELYVLDADAFHWSVPQVAGAVPVPLRAMTCTAVGKRLFIFGGGDGPTYYNDVHVFDTVNYRWSKPKILGDKAPSKRRAHTACLYKSGIYVFGGGDGVRALNDVWRLDVSDVSKMSWKLVSGPITSGSRSPSGAMTLESRPKARGYHTANMVGSKLIIFGGSDGGECFNDVWVYDVEMHLWKAVNIPVTFRRLSHTATIVGSYLFVIGGHDGNEYCNDVLLLNLVTMAWDKRKVYGLPPGGRGYHGTVLYDSRLIMIGGFDGGEVFGDVWILELAVHAYYSQISHFTVEV